jgi:hypothetical protein
LLFWVGAITYYRGWLRHGGNLGLTIPQMA